MATHEKRSRKINTKSKYEETINSENLKLLKKYMIYIKNKNLAKTTIYNYERDLIYWLSWINEHKLNCHLSEIDDDMVEEFIYFVREQGNNANRIKRRLSSIAAFYKYLKMKRLINDNPMDYIERPKNGLPVVKQTYLTKEQMIQIDNLLKDDDLNVYVYFLVSVSTAARIAAICSLRWEQLNVDEYIFEDVREKEGYIVDLILTELTVNKLLELKSYRENNNIDDDGYIFITSHNKQLSPTTANSWCKKIGEKIGEPTLHPHDWRHSVATIMKNDGADLVDISEMLNHSGTDVTRKHYIKISSEEKRKKIQKFQIL
jgi:site-specific recombinase XerD